MGDTTIRKTTAKLDCVSIFSLSGALRADFSKERVTAAQFYTFYTTSLMSKFGVNLRNKRFCFSSGDRLRAIFFGASDV